MNTERLRAITIQEKPVAPSPTCAKRIRREFRFRFGSKPGFTRFLAVNFKTKRMPMVLHAKCV